MLKGGVDMTFTKLDEIKKNEVLFNKSISIYPTQAKKLDGFKNSRKETWSEFIQHINDLLEKEGK